MPHAQHHAPRRSVALAVTVAALFALSCGGNGRRPHVASKTKTSAKEHAPKDGQKVGADKEDPRRTVAVAFREINRLGVSIEVPLDVTVMNGVGESVSIFNKNINIHLGVIGPMHPSDFTAAKKSVEDSPNKFKAFSKEEEFERGWHLEFELSGMGSGKTLYGVDVRKTIGDKQYSCSRNFDDKAKRDTVAKMCMSLKGA